MKATKDYISLETAKLLKDCGIKNKYVMRDNYPAFTWGEILWEHAEEFFGVDKMYYFYKNSKQNGFFDEKEFLKLFVDGSKYAKKQLQKAKFVLPYQEHTDRILHLLQQKKYDKADEYFRQHCILINNK